MNRWTKTKCQSAHVLHMLVIAPKAIRRDESQYYVLRTHRERQAAPLKISQALVSVKCVTNETYYFLLKQRDKFPKANSMLYSCTFISLSNTRFPFRCLFYPSFCALDDERKHLEFVVLSVLLLLWWKDAFCIYFCFAVHVLFHSSLFFLSFSTVTKMEHYDKFLQVTMILTRTHKF